MIKIDKRKLNKLRSDLKGRLMGLATMEGVHISTISRVLDGKIQNEKILLAAIKYRDDLVRKQSAIEEQI